MMSAALRLAQMGLHVFPCWANAKEPMGPWPQMATTDPLTIIEWWLAHPLANLAVACGRASGVTVQDFDVKDGKPGLETAGRLHPGGLPPHSRTPSGGVHVWTEWVAYWGNRKLAKLGLDVQGEGAYVLVPPSVVDGKPYLWVNCDAPVLTDWEPLKPVMEELLGVGGVGGFRPQRVGGGGGGGLPAGWDEVEVPGGLAARLPAKVVAYLREGELGDWPSRSEALMGACAALHGLRLSPAQVMRVLWEQPPVYAYLQEKADPAGWLWRYNVARTVPPNPFGADGVVPDLTGVVQGGAPEVVGEAAEAASAAAPAAPGDPVQDALALVEGLTPETVLDGVKRLARGMAECDFEPVDVEKVWERLQTRQFGISVKLWRDQLRLALKTVKTERRNEAKAKKRGPVHEYVYVESTGALWCLPEPGWYTQTAFSAMYGLDAEALRDTLAAMPRCRRSTYWPLNPWAQDGSYAPVEGVRWHHNTESQRAELNVWQEPNFHPDLSATERDVGPWTRHLRRTLRVPPAEAEHVLDWMAWTLQYPWRKINHMLMLGGGQGIGKDTLFEPLLRALGSSNALVVDGESVGESFDYEKLSHASMMLLQELSTSDDHREARRVYNRLKKYITTPPTELPINIKGIKQYHIPNLVNVAAVTNDPEAIRIEQDDRRGFLVWCEGRLESLQDAPVYFEKLWQWYGEGGCEAVAGWLLKRDLSRFSPSARPPATNWRERVLDDSLPPVAVRVRDIIENEEGVGTWGVCTAEDMLAQVQMDVTRFGAVTKPPTVRQVQDGLKRLGVRSRRLNDLAEGSRKGRGKTTFYILDKAQESLWLDAPERAFYEHVRVQRMVEG